MKKKFTTYQIVFWNLFPILILSPWIIPFISRNYIINDYVNYFLLIVISAFALITITFGMFDLSKKHYEQKIKTLENKIPFYDDIYVIMFGYSMLFLGGIYLTVMGSLNFIKDLSEIKSDNLFVKVENVTIRNSYSNLLNMVIGHTYDLQNSKKEKQDTIYNLFPTFYPKIKDVEYNFTYSKHTKLMLRYKKVEDN